MNIKIICLNEDKIEFEFSDGAFEYIESLDIKNKNINKFYKVEKDIIKIENCTLLNLEKIIFNNARLKNSLLMVMIREINESNINIISTLSKINNSILIMGKENLFNEDSKKEFNLIKNIVILNKLIEDKKINLKLLMFMLSNNEILSSIKLNQSKKYIIIENKKNIGQIVLSLLKQFKYIQYNKEYICYLYSREEINLEQISYLEDPIREYIENDDILTMVNLNSEKINYDEYVLVLLSK